jgi:segregation and condensation protein B
MKNGRDTIPIGTGKTPEEKNRFPGAVAFVETFDTDDDPSESADILSFESLREAFATLQSSETELAKLIPEIELSADNKPDAPEQPEYDINDAADSDDENNVPTQAAEHLVVVGTRLETILEAMLFVGNRENHPLSAEQIAEKLRNVSAGEVDQAVVRLNELYQERNRPYIIISERGGYRMILRLEFEPVRTNFYGKIRETRLSQQAIDTLAVVAYRQPITAEEIQNIRQQSCSAVLQQLVRRNLLKISREIQNKKSVVRYHTTSRFLEVVQIKSLNDIPRADELDYR